MNLFDQIAAARDIVRSDEMQWLFEKVYEEEHQVGTEVGEYHRGYLAALKFVNEVLDERLSELRDRWG